MFSRSHPLPLPRRGGAGRRIIMDVSEMPAADQDLIRRAEQPRLSRRALLRAPSLVRTDHRAGHPTRRRRPGHRLSAATIRSRRAAYGLWLAWLDHTEGLGTEPPATRVTPERVDAFIDFLAQNGMQEATIHARILWLTQLLRAGEPSQDWRWLARTVRGLNQKRDPDLILKTALQISLRDLAALGQRLMAEGEELARRPRARTGRAGAVVFRDGLMISLLVATLQRRRAFLSLHLRHLHRDGESLSIHVPTESTKSGRPAHIPVPGELVPALDRYLNIHRPRLQADATATGHVWIGDRGAPLGPIGIWHAITRRTRAALGIAIPPHIFRHLAATGAALDAPDVLHAMPTVLGHRNPQVMHEHYELSGELEARRQWTEILEGLQDNQPDLPQRRA